MENLRFAKNQLLKSVTQLFQVTEKLIKDQTEICGLTTIDYKQPTWRSTTLLCDKAVEITNAKTYVFADSVLCLGSMSVQPVEARKNKIKWYLETRYLKVLNRIDGEPMEFEWTIPQGLTTLGILEENKKMITELHSVNLSSSKEGSSSCQCTTTLYRENEETQEKCIMNSVTVSNYARRFLLGRWSFWEPGSEKKWYGTYSVNKTEIGTKLLSE